MGLKKKIIHKEYVFYNIKVIDNLRMEFLPEHVIAWSCLATAKHRLNNPCFESIVFRFIEIALELPKSPKNGDYSKALEHFRIHYFNEFLFKVTERNADCQSFIEIFDNFFKKTKIKKSDYSTLFQSLASFYKGSAGGTWHNKPLLLAHNDSLEKSQPLYLHWHRDQVQNIRNEMNMVPGKCVSCSATPAVETLVGTHMCPAACLFLCGNCEPNQELIQNYLQKCSSFMLPAPNKDMKAHFNETFDIWKELATGQSTTLNTAKLIIREHAKEIIDENKRLKKLNNGLKKELHSKNMQLQHALDANNEYIISLRDEQQAKEHIGQLFRRGERGYYELKQRHENMMVEMNNLKRQLNESVKAQWVYYNKLKELRII